MAVNITTRKGNVKNIRSHALNATKKRQNLNLQVYRLEDGTKVRMSAKEIRTLNKNEKAASCSFYFCIKKRMNIYSFFLFTLISFCN